MPATPGSASGTAPLAAVGRNVLRKDGREKTAGSAKYIDDLAFPGMLYGRTVRTEIPRGRVTSVQLDFGDMDPAEFTVVDHRDIAPGRNVVALITDDQPYLVEREVRHVAEPVLLLAHANRDRLRAVRATIACEREEPVFDPERSTVLLKELAIDKGDVDAAFAAADLVVEGEYRTGHQEHVYIETNGVIAVPEGDGITVYGSIQCPYYVHKALKSLLGWGDERVRVVQTETGGGFGGRKSTRT